MKQLFLVLAFAPLSLMASPNLSTITKALGEGDVATLSKFFGSDIELAVLEEEDLYEKTEAVQMLKDFFSTNKPSSFQLVHQGTSKGNGSHYGIGNLKCGTKTFRVYLYLEEVEDRSVIQELRFELE